MLDNFSIPSYNRNWTGLPAGDADRELMLSASACHINEPNFVTPGQILSGYGNEYVKKLNSEGRMIRTVNVVSFSQANRKLITKCSKERFTPVPHKERGALPFPCFLNTVRINKVLLFFNMG